MIKTKQFEGNLILNSIAVTIGMLAIVTSTTDLVMPSTYILGISIFTMTYSMIDLITKDDVPMFKTKIAKLRVKVYGTILSVPSAFGLTLLALNFNTPEEEIARQSNLRQIRRSDLPRYQRTSRGSRGSNWSKSHRRSHFNCFTSLKPKGEQRYER